MKPFKFVKRFGAKIAATVGTGVLVSGFMVGNALAALPASMATDVDDGKVDIATAGGYGITILLAILLFVWIRRVMK